MLRPYDYDAFLAPRRSQRVTRRIAVFANAYYNKRREDRYNWALGAPNSPDGLINGFPITQGYDYRSNTGVRRRVDVGALAARRCFDVRVSCTKFGE